MKQIPLMGNNLNLFHTRKDSAIQVRPRLFEGKPIMMGDGKTPAMEKIGKSNITGYFKGEISPGDQLLFHSSDIHTITNVIQRRNHAGEFTNSDDKKKRFL